MLQRSSRDDYSDLFDYKENEGLLSSAGYCLYCSRKHAGKALVLLDEAINQYHSKGRMDKDILAHTQRAYFELAHVDDIHAIPSSSTDKETREKLARIQKISRTARKLLEHGGFINIYNEGVCGSNCTPALLAVKDKISLLIKEIDEVERDIGCGDCSTGLSSFMASINKKSINETDENTENNESSRNLAIKKETFNRESYVVNTDNQNSKRGMAMSISQRIVNTVGRVHEGLVVPTVGTAGEFITRVDRTRIAKAFGPELAAATTEYIFNLLFPAGWNRFWQATLGLGTLLFAGFGRASFSPDMLDMFLHYGADMSTAWLRSRPVELASFANDIQVLGRNLARGNFGIVKNFSPIRSVAEIKSRLPKIKGLRSNLGVNINETIEHVPIEQITYQPRIIQTAPSETIFEEETSEMMVL